MAIGANGKTSPQALKATKQHCLALSLPPSIRCFRFRLIVDALTSSASDYEWTFDPVTKLPLMRDDPKCVGRTRRAWDTSSMWVKGMVVEESGTARRYYEAEEPEASV